MFFNSVEFLFFFPIVVFLYFLSSHKIRWLILLFASYYFYMSFKFEYGILIAISTLVTYFGAKILENQKDKLFRKLILGFLVIFNLSFLFFFKYFNFVSENLSNLIIFVRPTYEPFFHNFILPIGISFYTFQVLSYCIDVYSKKIKSQKHLGVFAVYVVFFPQLVAGPIERAKDLIPQFLTKHKFSFDDTVSGLKLILWGFFKKLVIADNVAILVNTVYSDVNAYNGTALILATVFFAFQIFCDFSAYSDIAIGCAKIMGFKLNENFRRPYFSTSIREFWRRWHISLTKWFRDYIYFPLGGNRVTIFRNSVNILVVFLVSGIWHGAAWTFIVWGLLHGAFMVTEMLFRNINRKINLLNKTTKKLSLIFTPLKLLVTFILVNITWIFFRSENLEDAIYVLTHFYKDLNFSVGNLGLNIEGIIIGIIAILIMEIVHLTQEFELLQNYFSKSIIVTWLLNILLILIILFFGSFQESQFIYFQF